MEIDFMILWKKKVAEKTDLLKKVKSMLKVIFTNTESDELHYTDEDSIIHFLPYSISSTSDDIVYLKIQCNYSESKGAEVLSKVRDILCKGKHKAEFSIICTYDDASLSFCCRLMKPFGVFERRLRELLYLTTVKAFGSDWVARTFPNEMIAKMKEKTGGLSNEKLTEKALELLDYNEINSYIFDKRRRLSNLELMLDDELSDENLEQLTKEQITQIIQKSRCQSLWDILFSDNETLKSAVQGVEGLRQYRNDTMHHHTMDIQTFKNAKIQLRKANSILKQAVSEMEHKIYTNGEWHAVLSTLSSYIPKIVESINKLFTSVVMNLGETVSTILRNLSFSMNGVSETLTNITVPQFDFKPMEDGLTVLEDVTKQKFEISEIQPLALPSPEVTNIAKSAFELSSSYAQMCHSYDIPKQDDIIETTISGEEDNI